MGIMFLFTKGNSFLADNKGIDTTTFYEHIRRFFS